MLLPHGLEPAPRPARRSGPCGACTGRPRGPRRRSASPCPRGWRRRRRARARQGDARGSRRGAAPGGGRACRCSRRWRARRPRPASITATSSPARVSITAVVRPVIPAPTMMTSCRAPASKGEPRGRAASSLPERLHRASQRPREPAHHTALTFADRRGAWPGGATTVANVNSPPRPARRRSAARSARRLGSGSGS